MALTLKQVVDKISSKTDRATVERRIRHWSSHGLLKIADRFPGQGQVRHYLDDDLYVAAVLNELARYGLPLQVLAPVSNVIYSHIGKDDDEWEEAKRGVGRVILFLTYEDKPLEVARFSFGITRMPDTRKGFASLFWNYAHSVIIVELSDLFKGLGP
jgi:hypothetical protein